MLLRLRLRSVSYSYPASRNRAYLNSLERHAVRPLERYSRADDGIYSLLRELNLDP